MKKLLLLSTVVLATVFISCEKDDDQFTPQEQQIEQGSPNQSAVFINKDEYDIPEDGNGN